MPDNDRGHRHDQQHRHHPVEQRQPPELLQDAAQLTPQRRALCTLLLTCARTIDRLCRKGRDISRMVTSYNETIDRLQPSETSAKAGDLAQLLKDMAQ